MHVRDLSEESEELVARLVLPAGSELHGALLAVDLVAARLALVFDRVLVALDAEGGHDRAREGAREAGHSMAEQ